jgi:regulator of protease activity HflC (stomatin/prohibitin superfamily)
VWQDPVRHQAIELHKAINLDASEALVVYRQEPGRVGRRIVRGPVLFVPAANEWLHQFSWHGSDATGRRKVPHALKFQQLRVIPDQMYADVEEVRTADDALILVKLMVFFELVDIEKMLDQTHDPIADFINAASADVIEFAATLGFEQFKEQTERLNDLATFPQLASRAERIGYRVNKVVFRGYHASAKLQAMHDGAIETRTRLQLEAVTEEQAQVLTDLKLAKDIERAEKRRETEAIEAEHKARLKRAEHDETVRSLRAEHEETRARGAEQQQALAARQAADAHAVQHAEAMKQQKLAYLTAVRGLQVDLTHYLTAKYRHPDRWIQVDGGRRPELHLHENGG